MEEATRQHFYYHGKEGYESEKSNCHWCQLRTFASHEEYPVTIVNEVEDGAVLPAKFRFIQASVLGNGVVAAEASFRSGCDCDDDEDCQYRECNCLQDHVDSDEDERANHYAGHSAGGRVKTYAYHTNGEKAGMLRGKLLPSRMPIYECHSACECSEDCPNRVVDRGRKLPLQIFRTRKTGWGVRCPVDIKKGQFIDKYVGEVITAKEATRRRQASDIAQRKDVYLFCLDKFWNPNSPDPQLRGPPLEVDGEFMSGPTRFINHSCEPNLRIFARVGDHVDKHIHDLAFFAIRDIGKGEQLTFDYVDGQDTGGDSQDPRKQKDMAKCLCGSEKCRGYLW